MTTLNDLVEKWEYAKEREREWNAQRLQTEEEILKHVVLPEKGTFNVNGKMKIQARLKETWDQGRLTEMKERINFPFWPFEQQWKPINKEIRTLEENFPEKWRELQTALTIEPAKPTFSIKGE